MAVRNYRKKTEWFDAMQMDARLRCLMGKLAVWHTMLLAIEADGSAERFNLDGHEHFLIAADALRLCDAIRQTAAAAVEARARSEARTEERSARVEMAAAARQRPFRKTHRMALEAIDELYRSGHTEAMKKANARFRASAIRIAAVVGPELAPAGILPPKKSAPGGDDGEA